MKSYNYKKWMFLLALNFFLLNSAYSIAETTAPVPDPVVNPQAPAATEPAPLPAEGASEITVDPPVGVVEIPAEPIAAEPAVPEVAEVPPPPPPTPGPFVVTFDKI